MHVPISTLLPVAALAAPMVVFLLSGLVAPVLCGNAQVQTTPKFLQVQKVFALRKTECHARSISAGKRSRHSSKPPSRLYTSLKPCEASQAAALWLELPW